MSTISHLLNDPRIVEILRCIGVPYFWGRGTPSGSWPPATADCSGFAQLALVRLGLLRVTEPDRNALSLANACVPITTTETVQLGDLVFYGNGHASHVMVALDADWCIGASGGGAETHGDDPAAYVQLKPIHYRRDFIVVGRIKSQFHP